MRWSKTLIAIWISLTIAYSDHAYAWNSQGHRVVAEIAEHSLNERARQQVRELLNSEGKIALQDVATWADEMRDLERPRQPSHSIRLPLSDEPYSQERDCRNKNCILEAIKVDLSVLKDKGKSLAARVAALKYLTHFIGDLHQPLHASIDSGQREVVFQGKEMTLHGVWDRGLIQCQIKSVEALAGKSKLYDPSDVDFVSWAEESRAIARDFIFPDLAEASPGPLVLKPSYCNKFGGVVLKQLEKAGLRLGNLLNQTLGKQEEKRS